MISCKEGIQSTKGTEGNTPNQTILMTIGIVVLLFQYSALISVTATVALLSNNHYAAGCSLKKIKSSLYSRYQAEAMTSGRAHFRGLAPGKRRNVAGVVSP